MPDNNENELTEENLKDENLHDRARSYNLSPEKEEIVKLIRWAFSEMYNCFDAMLETNRESSLAYTKLEEAQMWAIKSVTHNNYSKTMDEISEFKK